MDWPRAKTILIVAFLITDLLLIAVYWFPQVKIGEMENSNALIDVLAKKNIYVEADIPQKHNDMPVLYVQHEFCDEDMIESLLAEQKLSPIEADGDEDYRKRSEEFIRKAGLTYDTLVFDKVEREGSQAIVYFSNQINGMPIESSHIICVFQNRVLTGFEYNWLHAESFNNKKQSTISAAEALLIFMYSGNSGQNNRIVIEEIKMVYWLGESGMDVDVVADTAIPAWEIVYNGGETEYINAYEQ